MLKTLRHRRRARQITIVALLWGALAGCQTALNRNCNAGVAITPTPRRLCRTPPRSNDPPAPSHGPASPPTGFR